MTHEYILTHDILRSNPPTRPRKQVGAEGSGTRGQIAALTCVRAGETHTDGLSVPLCDSLSPYILCIGKFT